MPSLPRTAARRRGILFFLAGVAGIATAALVLLWRPAESPPSPTPPPAPRVTYAGGATCMGCHPAQRDLWQGSDHARAMLAAEDRNVLGDFEDATFTKNNVTSTFLRRDGRYLVRTDGPDGMLREYEIAYTFGADPLQQYLVPFPNGRYQALSIAWDARPAAAGGQRWFHLYPKETIDHRDVLHWTGPLQNWNYMCADCHSTNLKENYRLAEDRYDPSWTDIAVSCEACHGPGSGHVEWAERAGKGQPVSDPLRGFAFELKDGTGDRWVLAPGEIVARRAKPPASRAKVETCAPCHARRATIWGAQQPGQPLEQTYRLSLLEDSLYHADGQIQDEVYEYGSFLQSRMYQSGVTCSDCHDPHSARLRLAGNALCSQCHLSTRYDGPQHHHHTAGTEAGRCVSCHMPSGLYMVVDGRRDHGFRIPRPDLSERIGTPNACNQCHEDRPASWAAAAVGGWYGEDRRGGWHWAEAIHAGRAWQAAAGRQLARAVDDPAIPGIARATALSLLPSYLHPESVRSVETSLRDPDPLVRRSAAAALSALEPGRRVPLGVPLLEDTIRSVRFEALSVLLDAPRESFTRDQLATLDQVIDEYRRAQTSLADRVESHLNLGALDARLGRIEAAEAAYRTAIRLQPMFIPAYINLADLYRQQGREDQVGATLQEAMKRDPKSADACEAMGLSLVRQKRLPDALPLLEKAALLREDVPRHAYVYAVALHEAGEKRRALEVLESAQKRQPAYRDILVALAAYHRDAGDRTAALAWARKLADLSPGDGAAARLVESLEEEP